MFGITPIVVTSPIPSHPSTAIIDQTIKSIRFHMPDSHIIIMADGVRPEQSHLAPTYDEYIDKLIFSKNKTCLIENKFLHQVGMMRRILPEIETELLLFCEHDTPLVTDEEIDWYSCCQMIDRGEVNLIRFLHEAHIHPEHQHLMRGPLDVPDCRIGLTKTVQFSARPHLASVAFYKKLLSRLSPHAKCFIEDPCHGFCQTDPWEEWKMSIYTPFGNMKRSLHADGRAGGPKWDDQQVF